MSDHSYQAHSSSAASTHRRERFHELHGVPTLVVDDDAVCTEQLRELLADLGCDASFTRCSEEAMATLWSFKPTLVILDLVLPTMCGLLLAQKLRAAPATRGAVIVALSSLSKAQTEHTARAVGCNACIQKPIDTRTFPELFMRIVAEGWRTR